MKCLIISITGFLCALILLIVLLNKSCTSVIDEVKKVDNIYKSYLGKQIVLSKDTFTVIDYSITKETFTLTNGVIINSHMIDSLIIK